MFFKISTLLFVCLGISAAQACPTGLREFNKNLGNKTTCVLEGTYVGSLELSSGFSYLLLGAVYIGSEKRNSDLSLQEPIQRGRLVINPGVHLFALNPAKDTTGLWAGFTDSSGQLVDKDMKSFLSVTRDSQIVVNGTQSSPVLMTSAQGAHLADANNVKKPGDWGGLVISGKARSNKCLPNEDCTLPGEASTGWYGGDDDFHSSGSLEFLQVEFGGDRLDDEKELNGITFNTVGLGTTVHDIAVLYNSDDCIEFFGGAVTARNVFCYKGEDDGVDTTDGARVFIQNGVVVAADFPEAGDDNDRHMVEADSAKNDAANLRIQSHPILINFSFVGGLNSQGLMMRRQTNYTLLNSVMTGVDQWCLKQDTADQPLINSNIFADCSSNDPVLNYVENQFVKSSDLLLNQWLPAQGSPLLSGALIVEEFYPQDMDLDDAFYDAYDEVDYRGAMGLNDWTTWIKLRQ